MNIETEQHLKDYFALKNTINIINGYGEDIPKEIAEYLKLSKFELLAKLTDNSKVISLDKEISRLAYEQITKEVCDISERYKDNNITDEESILLLDVCFDTITLPFESLYLGFPPNSQMSDNYVIGAVVNYNTVYVILYDNEMRQRNNAVRYECIMYQHCLKLDFNTEPDNSIESIRIILFIKSVLRLIEHAYIKPVAVNKAHTWIRKAKRNIPNYYYTVVHKSGITVESEHTESTKTDHSAHSFQYDVCANWAVRFTRGDLPVNKWIDDGNPNRTIFYHDTPIPEEYQPYFEAKGITIAENEWVSVLKYWRKEHIRGPKDAPYVPAIRVVK